MPRQKLAVKADKAAPSQAIAYLKRAISLHQREDFKRAEPQYRAALKRDPQLAYAHQLLGVMMLQTSRFKEAATHLDQAAALSPESADIQLAHGNALFAVRRFREAVHAYEKAVEMRPHDMSALHGHGRALVQFGRVADALEVYDRALEIAPEHPGTLCLRIETLSELRRFDEAFAEADRVMAKFPDYPPIWLHQGVLHHNTGRLEKALEYFDVYLQMNPGDARGWMNQAVVLGRLRRVDEAAATFAETMRRFPHEVEAQFLRAAFNLMRGEYILGWSDHETRLIARSDNIPVLPQPIPPWRGEPIAGKRILVYDEQGNGDVIMFCRYVCELEALGALVTFAVREPLRPLARSLSRGVAVTTIVAGFDGFDYAIPVMSLPYVFKTDLSSVPSRVPYLKADPERVAWWRARLGDGFKVGVCWASSVWGVRQGRSAEARNLACLSQIPGVRLLCLQKEVGPEMWAAMPADVKIEPLGEDYERGDFLETAAVIEALDLVVCVDTAVAHLAGALGRPFFLALPFISDWRWLQDRPDSPWYPTARVFRSTAFDNWDGVFAQMVEPLRALAQAPEPTVNEGGAALFGP